MECNQCGSTENVKEFMHFHPEEWEYLCWDCRYPIIKERVDGDDGDDEPEDPNGQSGLNDFF